MENVIDPAHVPFAHHGVQASRNQAMPINISIRYAGPEGVSLALPRLANSTIEFQAPILLRYKFDFTQFFARIKPVNFIWNLEKKLRGLPKDAKPQSLLVSYAIPRYIYIRHLAPPIPTVKAWSFVRYDTSVSCLWFSFMSGLPDAVVCWHYSLVITLPSRSHVGSTTCSAMTC